MDFQNVTSFIAAVGGVCATALGFLVLHEQRNANRRNPPIIELHGFTHSTDDPDQVFLKVVVRNTEEADYSLERIRANKAVLIPRDDDSVPQRETDLWMGPTIRKGGRHYLVPVRCSSSQMRSRITFIWRWKDESRSRTSRKKIAIPARMAI
jgi:hypothetical protein